ncbi:hypothetical protein ABCS02_24505 [Microbacterium sp. X-17]|uniref:hypothetical protein n=1 Tax=Microbacterium sp. X-17 TaxID=3144404 RepID=UPI0031F4BB71
MRSPSLLLYAGDRLTLAELCAARLDGDVVELGEAFLPADAVESAALRAQSLAPLLTPAVAITHASAAWVHGAIPEAPARHTLQRAVPWRPHHLWDRRFVYRDALLPADDVRELGGIAIASRERTVVDLLRRGAPGDQDAARSLAGLHPEVLPAALRWTERNLPHAGMRAARARLLAWTVRPDGRDYEEVTR